VVRGRTRVDALALGDAADELPSVERLGVAAGVLEQPHAQLVGKLLAEVARLAPCDALAERAKRRARGALGLLPRDPGALLDALATPPAPAEAAWISRSDET